jgi:hypothetical protein
MADMLLTKYFREHRLGRCIISIEAIALLHPSVILPEALHIKFKANQCKSIFISKFPHINSVSEKNREKVNELANLFFNFKYASQEQKDKLMEKGYKPGSYTRKRSNNHMNQRSKQHRIETSTLSKDTDSSLELELLPVLPFTPETPTSITPVRLETSTPEISTPQTPIYSKPPTPTISARRASYSPSLFPRSEKIENFLDDCMKIVFYDNEDADSKKVLSRFLRLTNEKAMENQFKLLYQVITHPYFNATHLQTLIDCGLSKNILVLNLDKYKNIADHPKGILLNFLNNMKMTKSNVIMLQSFRELLSDAETPLAKKRGQA